MEHATAGSPSTGPGRAALYVNWLGYPNYGKDKADKDGIFANFTLAPYDVRKIEYWKAVRNDLGGFVDRVYLQCCDGGRNNNPAQWEDALNTAIDPGLWCKHEPDTGCDKGDSPAVVEERMGKWRKDTGIPGGFMWCYPDMRTCSGTGYTVADYASAITRATRAPEAAGRPTAARS